MSYLIVSGIIAVAAGVLILLADHLWFEFCSVVDQVVVELDAMIRPYKMVIGIVMLMIAGWMYYLTTRYTAAAAWLHFLWPVALIFGLLYLFIPGWLDILSRYANMVVFPTKEKLKGASRAIGTILILAGAYILIICYIYWR